MDTTPFPLPRSIHVDVLHVAIDGVFSRASLGAFGGSGAPFSISVAAVLEGMHGICVAPLSESLLGLLRFPLPFGGILGPKSCQ